MSVFRKEYKPLTDAQKSVVSAIKDQASILYDCLINCPIHHDARHMAIAITNLEQSIMWAVKAVTA